jgi:hypothetical protein
MTTVLILTIAGVVVAVAGLIGRAYVKYRGKRLVGCPETSQPAAVDVDAWHAALTGVVGKPTLRLASCSRWPARHDCGQQCLRQIEQSPEGCLVRTLLTEWYAGKQCVLCGRDLGHIDWIEHKPALMTPGNITVQWDGIDVVKLDEVLVSHKPVCWNCHVAETFRRERPDLVIDNPWETATRKRA